MLRPGFPRLSHPEVAHAIPSVGFMAQVYRRVRLLVSPTIVGVQLTDQQRTAQAPNAALAVIKWKKVRGFYNDLTRELNCEYVIDGNKLINSFCLDAPS